jgi:hypothetical protein
MAMPRLRISTNVPLTMKVSSGFDGAHTKIGGVVLRIELLRN